MTKDVVTTENLSRRNIIAGAAIALGATSLLKSQDAKAGTFTPANVVDLGADPTGATPSNTAITSALSTGQPVYFPPGKYLITTPITTSNRDLVIFGDGPDVAQIWVSGNINGITFTGNLGDYTIDQLVVSRIGLLAKNGTCAAAIDASWSDSRTSPAATVPAAIIKDVSISYQDSSSRFSMGIKLNRGPASRIVDCHLSQAPNQNPTATGIYLTTPSGTYAPDTRIVGCELVGQNIGILIDSSMEGITVSECTIIGVYTGIRWDASSRPQGTAYLHVSGCHFNVWGTNGTSGIHTTNVFNVVARGNNFLIAMPNATGVRMDRANSTINFYEDSIIAHNNFHLNASSGANYGITISGYNSSRRAEKILIDGNRFGGLQWTNTVYLGTDTTNIVYTGTNLADSGETVADLGYRNKLHSGQLNSTSTPGFTMTDGAGGSFAAGSYCLCDYVRNGENLALHVVLVITGGSGIKPIIVTFPTNFALVPVTHCTLSGMRIDTTTGAACQGVIAAIPPPYQLKIVDYANNFPAGSIFAVSGTMRSS